MDNWKHYQTQFHEFLSALAQAELIARVGGTALANFPQNLPHTIRRPVVSTLRRTGKALEKAAARARRGVEGELVELGAETHKFAALFMALLTFVWVADRGGAG
jgi:hypothetical protein